MPIAEMKSKNAVESLRDIVQDLLVPELKALKSDVEALRREIRVQFETVQMEMQLRDEKQTNAIRSLAENSTQAIQALSDKVGYMLEVRERLAVLEDRAKRD